MGKNLLIVESPAKAKTLAKYLGPSFTILASYGHVRDLLPKTGAVDTEHDFAMKYAVIEKNAKHVAEICTQLKKADTLYLATDPDREGEAISWHLCELLQERGLLKDKTVHRVVFYEITKTAVQAAVKNPRAVSMDLVNAQQARRALDYLVGFNLSPLLWKKIRRGLSAGRVQSPALRLIVEREEAIEQFKSQEYWSLEADLKAKKQAFTARLVEYQNKKVEQFSVTTAVEAHAIQNALQTLAKGKLRIEKITKSQKKRNPTAPFTTSTLQQEASRKLGFTTQKTMRVAQQLYEGVDVGEGAAGLITYMRTDSVSLAAEAVAEIRRVIEERYGAASVPELPRIYKTKSKNAQEAHEAIRPTMPALLPDTIRQALTPDQHKLYALIWKRTVASQMIHATIDAVAVDLSCGPGNRFRANGSIVAIPGFMQVYLEGVDDTLKSEDDEGLLPPLVEGECVDLSELRAEQHFTEPPPRFSEASLVKTLEEHGIGRPSTYASIISTLQQRAYVILETKRFKPTDVGRIVNKFLTKYFTSYVDYNFTAKLEDELDAVARGEKQWLPLMATFWKPFIELVHLTEGSVKRQDVTQEALEEACPKCSQPLSIRLGKRGRFIGCTTYPACDYTRSMEDEPDKVVIEPKVVEGRTCPKCESALLVKRGKYGDFIGCSAYPKCRHIESLEKALDTEVLCPQCQKSTLIKKKSRYGTYFYACQEYPACKYAVNHPPLSEPCPQCHWPILTLKTTKRKGVEKTCPVKECDFALQVEGPQTSDA